MEDLAIWGTEFPSLEFLRLHDSVSIVFDTVAVYHPAAFTYYLSQYCFKPARLCFWPETIQTRHYARSSFLWLFRARGRGSIFFTTVYFLLHLLRTAYNPKNHHARKDFRVGRVLSLPILSSLLLERILASSSYLLCIVLRSLRESGNHHLSLSSLNRISLLGLCLPRISQWTV